MKFLKLTNSDKPALIDDEDFSKVTSHNWTLRGNGLIQISNSKKYGPISLASYIMHDRRLYDHRDRDPYNNQKSNLRLSTISQNNMNKGKYDTFKTPTSQYKGVNWNKSNKCWVVRIQVNGIRIFVGNFSNEINAAKAYDNAAIKYHEEFAVLNFPDTKEY